VPLNLVDRFNDTRQFDRAEALGRRFAGRQNVGYLVVPAIILAQNGQGHYATADSTLAAFRAQRGADDPAYLDAARRQAVNRLRFAEADSLLSRITGAVGGPRLSDRRAQSQLLRLDGRPAEADRVRLQRDSLRGAIAAAAGARIVPEAERLIDRARDDLWLRARPDRAAARLDSLLPMLRGPNDLGDRLLLAASASLEAAAGNPTSARAMLERALHGADHIAQRALVERRHTTLAEIALAEGRYAEAMAHFRASDLGPDSLPSMSCAVCVLPHLARTSERAGWTDSSRIFWERYVTEPAVQRLDTDQWFLAMAYRRLADAYTKLGNVAKAEEYRRRLADLRKNPEPDIARAQVVMPAGDRGGQSVTRALRHTVAESPMLRDSLPGWCSEVAEHLARGRTCGGLGLGTHPAVFAQSGLIAPPNS
jgi:tetratricopeptide (TPR) repeat protein